MQKFKQKKAYNTTLKKIMQRKINAHFRAKKAPNTILKNLCQGEKKEKMNKFEPKKKQLTLPYKNSAEKKIAQI